jgi:hypothetical protein
VTTRPHKREDRIMAVRIIRDVTDELCMPVDTSAVIAHCPGGVREYAVAGGVPADLLYQGTVPEGWKEEDNGIGDWIDWYLTLEDAEEAVSELAEALGWEDEDED